jgi:hypothetical protein
MFSRVAMSAWRGAVRLNVRPLVVNVRVRHSAACNVPSEENNKDAELEDAKSVCKAMTKYHWDSYNNYGVNTIACTTMGCLLAGSPLIFGLDSPLSLGIIMSPVAFLGAATYLDWSQKHRRFREDWSDMSRRIETGQWNQMIYFKSLQKRDWFTADRFPSK